MKIDAIVNDPIIGSSGYTKIAIDIDYVEDNEESVREWIFQELEKKYIGKQINPDFEVENMNGIIEDIKFDEFESKTN